MPLPDKVQIRDICGDDLVSVQQKALDELKQLNSAQSKIDATEKFLNTHQLSRKSPVKSILTGIGVYFLAFMILGMITTILTIYRNNIIITALYVLIMFFGPIITVIIFFIKRNRKNKKLKTDILNIEKLRAEGIAEYEKVMGNVEYILYIPEEYRYPLALQTMISFIKRGQTDNWQRCVDLYEEHLYRWRMERNSAEALELNRQTLYAANSAKRSSAAAAIFSGINLFFR